VIATCFNFEIPDQRFALSGMTGVSMIATGMTTRAERIAAVVFALIGLFALLLQHHLLVQGPAADGLSFGKATLRYFTFFTVQANILVVLMLLAFALRPKIEEWTVHPFERSAIASYIAVVALVYLTTLRELWAPQGWQWVADVLLHYLMPLGYLAFWLFVMRKAGLCWYDPLLWLIYPVFYLGFVLVQARVTGFYPYPFIDVSRIGYGPMALNALGIAAAFLVAGFVVLLAKREPV
jgi:hypothetical protein